MITDNSRLEDRFRDSLRASLHCQPDLLITEWAERFGRVPAVGSAQPGRMDLSKTPHIREILDRFHPSDPCERVVCQFGAQLQKTTTILLVTGYYIHWDPSSIITYFPNVEPKLEQFVRQKLDPLIADIPELVALVGEIKRGGRRATDTTTQKEYPGGLWTGAGATTGNAFRAISASILLLDEFDDYPDDVNGEGAPDDLAFARASTFKGRRKLGLFSTPTIKDSSKIEDRFTNTDQRYYWVPCPDCGQFQRLHWRDPVTKQYSLEWSPGNAIQAQYRCCHCGYLISDYQKNQMLPLGQWRPERTVADGWDGVSHGYHLSSLYSAHGLGWSWGELVVQWERIFGPIDQHKTERRTGDIPKLKTFVNTVLAETWEDRGRITIEPETVEARQEPVPPAAARYGIFDPLPPEALGIFVGVDTHPDRLPYQVVAFGRGRECWSVEYAEIDGDVSTPTVQALLDELVRRTWRTTDGRELPVLAACIDMQGGRSQDITSFCRDRYHDNVIAIVGAKELDTPIIDRKPKKKLKTTARGYQRLGVNAAKDLLFAWLQIDTPGPGYVHFPRGRDQSYYAGLIASERKLPRVENGRTVWRWVARAGARNEPLDTFVYAIAALHYWEQKTGQRIDEGIGSRFTTMPVDSGQNFPNNNGRVPTAHQQRQAAVSGWVQQRLSGRGGR